MPDRLPVQPVPRPLRRRLHHGRGQGLRGLAWGRGKRQRRRWSSGSGPRSSATTRCMRRARTARAGSPTPTTPRPAGRSPSSRTSSASEVLPRYANTHTETLRHRPADRPGCARTPARIIRDAVGGDDDDVVHLLRLGLDRRDRQADRHPRPAHPGRPRRPLRPVGAHPAGRAAGRLHRAVRAPLQRAALARVDRRRGGRSPRTPTATSTSAHLRARAAAATPTGR